MVRRNKYGNKRVTLDGYKFDSIAESKRYAELKLLEKAGEIKDLEVHVIYPLMVKGMIVGRYEADFVYTDKATGAYVTEDVKGHRTREYILKKNLMKAIHGIEIWEIKA